jgi:hypothetical protein
MKRTQIQIAVDALKKQLDKYREQHAKAIAAAREAQQSEEFFAKEMQRLKEQIASLEGTDKISVAV